MRTNTSRILTAFSDLPHPDRSPTYPASHAIRDYLHEYAERFSLTPCVQLNTPVVHLERAAESGAAFDPSREEATFRIAVTDNASQVLCPALCRALLPFRGRVSCQFVAPHAGTFEDMERGRLDLTLNADDGYTPSRFHREVIYEDEFVCVVAKSSRYIGRFTLRQYLDGTHVGMTVLTGQPMIHDQQLAALGQRRRSVLEVPYFGAAIRCVPGTDLIATVPRRFAEIQRHNRAIKFLPPPREIHGFKYLMIWHPRLHTDPAHVWLRGLIATAAAELGK
jgi:DNA-binding transcriptional LysR family regulator